ncbi:MAG: phenylacetate--CoA ligase family protein [Gammaproteobacteria bacterium]|nr:phenylacetate--CoA ligase family protein [Gammaproteobacteria bacterium]
MLARGFLANGLCAGDKVINLFVAGNLWSSFLVVHEALQRCGVYILPMGGLSPTEEIVACLTSFKPNVAFGLPSLLVDCARHCEKAGVEINVDKIFYAGEHFNPSARRYLRTVWRTQSFHSAGYAAVDVGPIGWQCTHCQGGEHHLFAREVHMEIVGEEAVITSLVRRAMPVIRYRTGDRVEWLPGHCACGNRDPRFRLLGRIDGLMNVWGCHLALADVETSLIEAGMTASIFQLVLCIAPCDSGYSEQLVVRLEQSAVAPDFLARFSERLHHNSKDVGLTLSRDSLFRQLRVECVVAQGIPRIKRTGKVRLIIDQRESGQE